MRKLRHYCLFLLLCAAILTGCSSKSTAEDKDENNDGPSFYSPFKLI